MSSEPDTEYEVEAYSRKGDALPLTDKRFSDKTDAIHQKALWERAGAEKVTLTPVSDRRDAHEEDECLLCAPAPHPNCEMHTVVSMLSDPMDVPLGEDYDDHLVDIPVCLEHYQALQQYQQGKNVAEVDVR